MTLEKIYPPILAYLQRTALSSERYISSHHDCVALQNNVNHLFRWTQKWQLSLNISKCKMMRVTNKKKLISYTYCLNNSPLEWVDTYKYLGVKIQSKLVWGEHILDVSNKVSRMLNVLRRSMYGCHHAAKKSAYMALVRPHLEYCFPVWSPHQHKLNELSTGKGTEESSKVGVWSTLGQWEIPLVQDLCWLLWRAKLAYSGKQEEASECMPNIQNSTLFGLYSLQWLLQIQASSPTITYPLSFCITVTC